MQKILAVLVSIIFLCTGLFAVDYFYPSAKEHIPFKDKIPFLNKTEKQVSQTPSEFLQIEGQTFDPRNSSMIQMLISRKKASFDGRKWHQEVGSANEKVRGVRLMPEGNSKDNWKEALDVTQFSDPKFFSVTKFAELHKDDILNKYPNAVWRILKQDNSGIVYDWTVVNDPKLGDQTTVGKILMDDEGIFHIYYINRHTPNVSQTRKTFLTFVDNL